MRLLGLHAAVIVAYLAAAAVGFRLAFVAEQVTTAWAPTGIAIAALLLGGIRLWPAVWLGAFLANAGSTAPLWTAIVIASGNTLEAVAAAWWLRRLPQFQVGLRRIREVLAFVLVAAVACTAISATIGVVTLSLAGVQPWSRFGALWFDWWLGDALGAVVVGPAILTGLTHSWSRRELLGTSAWVADAVILAHVIFGQPLAAASHPLEYVVFPLVIGAAVAGGPHVTPLVVLAASVVTIWHTVHGAGPFASGEVHYSLILLQVFMGVLSATSLLLASAIAERTLVEQREQEAATSHAYEFERTLARRAEAEAALRESRDVLSLAMRGGSMGAWARNLRTNEVWWSRELEEMFGLAAGEFNRTEEGFFGYLHEDDKDVVRKAVDDAVRTSSDYTVEFRFRHASGEWRWMEGRGRAVYADDRTPRNLYGIGIDITDRKRAEMALRDAKVAAESANQLKDQFLANLSHELRTPLNAILGYARMLQTDSIAPEKRQRAIDVIERNAVAQNQLVEDLLDMSRITTGKVRLEPEPVAIAAIVRDAIEGIRPAADAKRIGVDIELDPFAGTIRADASRLQQVFWNVLTNAVKFTPDGGHVTVLLRRLDVCVEVVVTDTGIGISPDFLPYVFDPFRQAESRFSREHGGLGLGLAIAKQLVELHGGSIAASSAGTGLGSTLTIQLPCMGAPRSDVAPTHASASPVPAEPARTLAPAASLAGLHILLVDDEEDTLTMFRDVLEEAGAHVTAVSSGAAAINVAEEWRPDLLVTDLGLPGMDGYQLLEAMRSLHPRDSCPAVAVSAYARLDDRSRALAAGFQAHVAKPIDPAALVRSLLGVLDGT